MKKIVFILVMFFLPVLLYSQSEQQTIDKNAQKELRKEKRKADKKAAEDSIKQVVTYMVENHRFVLEADYVAGKSGARVPVNSTINFITVDSLKAVIQLASGRGDGSNGIGGITVDGSVSRYELSKIENKKGLSYTITLYVNTLLGTYDIVLWVSQNGNTSATIHGTSAGSLSYSGTIVPLELSNVYKAHSYP
jgi:Domain of unknown function (DUF4251)